jgi:hypothetical protein
MRLPYQGFNFFFVAALTMILLLTAILNFGSTNTLATTLTPPLASPIQANQGNTAQPEGQVGKIARETPDQLQLKEIAQAMAKKSEQSSPEVISHIVSKYSKKGKLKQSGGLRGNMGWLTF